MRIPTTIQNLMFRKESWTAAKARAWLKRHHHLTQLDEGKTVYRFRQLNPSLFDPRSFRVIELPGTVGIEATIGHLHVHGSHGGHYYHALHRTPTLRRR